MKDLLYIAKNIAADARAILKERDPSRLEIINNENKDIKLSADIIAHNFILNALAKTEIFVFSEESQSIKSFNLNDYQWIVDPLDGTLNYLRGFKMSAISISLWKNGEPLIGVIAPTFSKDIYFAEKGKGAWLNEEKISVSKTSRKSNAILATGFPSGRNYAKDSLMNTLISISKYKKIRMLGSAVLMLTMVASGAFDVYEEEDIFIWDVAAGLMLIKEAGGLYSMEKGSSSIKYNVRASNKNLFNSL